MGQRQLSAIVKAHPGRGAVWLARLTGGQEVGSSNLPGPTGEGPRSEPVRLAGSFRSGPTGDQPGDQPRRQSRVRRSRVPTTSAKPASVAPTPTTSGVRGWCHRCSPACSMRNRHRSDQRSIREPRRVEMSLRLAGSSSTSCWSMLCWSMLCWWMSCWWYLSSSVGSSMRRCGTG
jgi:hypothetical protein